MSPRPTRSNLDINRDVRRILVANWIDLGRISIHSVKSSLYLRGSLQKLPGYESQLVGTQVEEIYRRIMAVAGIQNIYVDLDNWFRSSATGSWDNSASRATTKSKGGGHFDKGTDRKSFDVNG